MFVTMAATVTTSVLLLSILIGTTSSRLPAENNLEISAFKRSGESVLNFFVFTQNAIHLSGVLQPLTPFSLTLDPPLPQG